MEENQTSESVAVLPDMSEPLTSESEETSALTTEHEAHPVAVTSVPGVTSVQGVGVPVSLPVGSIIGVANASNGATFNVITSDQLQVFFIIQNIFFSLFSFLLSIFLYIHIKCLIKTFLILLFCL